MELALKILQYPSTPHPGLLVAPTTSSGSVVRPPKPTSLSFHRGQEPILDEEDLIHPASTEYMSGMRHPGHHRLFQCFHRGSSRGEVKKRQPARKAHHFEMERFRAFVYIDIYRLFFRFYLGCYSQVSWMLFIFSKYRVLVDK